MGFINQQMYLESCSSDKKKSLLCVSYSLPVSAYCLPSITFCPFSFLNTGKAKCSHTSKTHCFTNFGPWFALVTCTICYFSFTTIFVQANRAQTMMGTHGSMVTVVPASFLTAAEKTTFFCSEDLSLETHDNTDTLLTP